jgi:hypothetical protein
MAPHESGAMGVREAVADGVEQRRGAAAAAEGVPFVST